MSLHDTLDVDYSPPPPTSSASSSSPSLSSSSSCSLPDASIEIIPSHDSQDRVSLLCGSNFVEVDEWVAVLPPSTFPPPYYPTAIPPDGGWDYLAVAQVSEAFPAFMEKDADMQWPSRSQYARAVSSYNEAVRAGAESWNTSWLSAIVLTLAVISIVGMPYLCYVLKQEHDWNQAMFQAVVGALRASNEELDEAWRAAVGTEGRRRRRWQWRWVGRHTDKPSSRPQLALLHIPA
jgi:hypothetical protein